MKLLRRTAATLALSLALLAISTGVASAHVTVSAPGAVAGGSDQIITFRVPNEEGTAATTRITVQLPTDTPFASVLVAPHAGWTDKVTSVTLSTPIKTDDGTITEAVSTITWTARTTADGVQPGQFDQFVIIAGLLPDVPTVTFKAIQHYSDNVDVSWVEVAAPGSPEPDHPAPTLTLSAAGSSSPTATTSTGTPTATTSTGTTTGMDMSASGYAKQSGVTTALITAAIAVVLAAAGAALGLVAWRRSQV